MQTTPFWREELYSLCGFFWDSFGCTVPFSQPAYLFGKNISERTFATTKC